MALNKIQESVTASARNEAEHIVRAAEQAAKDRVSREVDAIRREEEHRYQLAARGIEDAAARNVSRARGEYAKQILQRRNAVLERIFEEARRQILSLPANACAEDMRRRLESAAGDSGGKLRVHADDRGTAESVLSAFNAARPQHARVTLDSETLSARSGFVFIADSFEVDQTLDTLLSELKYELGPQLAARLFPE